MNHEPIRDIAHLAHIELLTPKPNESLNFFKELLGMEVVHSEGQSVFLRGWGDQPLYSLKLTEAKQAGLGHVAMRTFSPYALEQRALDIEKNGFGLGWTDGDYGHGRSYQFTDADGHNLEIYYEAEKYITPDHLKPGLKNMPAKYAAKGASVTQLDHINLFSSDVDADSLFFRNRLGFKLSEQAITDDGKQTTAWLHVTNKSYDLAISHDKSGSKGRFHHAAFKVESPEMVLRAADVFLDNGIFIEAPPNKHVAGQTMFVYVYEPGGNRIEVCAGGFLIFSPDWETVTWTPEERKKGLAWGTPLPSTFHTYGTPDISK
ncbi:catechol 2,3-dioxygenase [Neobacillus niacini]|uniref:VOC family protein n=1 Tax=Neobacillus driksii TaxID=3035913 RepID=UPI002789FAB5|nr:VOC family protein [Neobacillus niacini]MDQ0972071.1 catechol 2,3-dioxygenase [Neobacillus niacini]